MEHIAMPTMLKGPPAPLDVREIRDALRLSRERMGYLLGLSSKSIERYEAAHRLPTNALTCKRLARLAEIVRFGREVYTPDGFVRFLATPLPVFGGRSAYELIAQGEEDRVLGALLTDYEGGGH